MIKHYLFTPNYKKAIKLLIFGIFLSLFTVLYLDLKVYHLISSILSAHLIVPANYKHPSKLFQLLTAETSLFLFVLIAIGIIFGSAIHLRNNLAKRVVFIFFLYQTISLITLILIKTELKYIFGRCVPEVCFLSSNAIPINDYGFSWFNLVSGFASFPSGHCILMSYCLVWARVTNPSLNKLFFSIFILLFSGLTIFNFHFLGDCIAGTVIGACFAIISIFIWNQMVKGYLFLRPTKKRPKVLPK